MRTNTILLLLAIILVVACAYRLWSWYGQAFGFDNWWDVVAPLAVAAIAYGSVLLNRRR